ncbi:MAG TPA: diacylglycerol kinase family protein [Solirubrobacteraceae bacterium]|nr:diacylglycerol kinase family protein [Solirubrobacteraceae bacterium]
MRIALIANPAAGGGQDPEPLAAAMRRHGAEVGRWGLAVEELEAAARWGPDRIAVAGGDGTVGPCADLAGRLRVPLAVIPVGTANDFARSAELPLDVEAACELAVTGTELRLLDLGRLADGWPFVNVASAGLASGAARRAQALKPWLGPLAYAVGALRAAASETPLRCTVRADGREVYAGGAWQAIVAVTGAFGGGSKLGAADPADGALDVAVLPAGSRLGLARRAWGMRRGTLAEQRDVRQARAHTVEVDLPPETELDVDGELRNDGMQHITVERDSFALVVG